MSMRVAGTGAPATAVQPASQPDDAALVGEGGTAGIARAEERLPTPDGPTHAGGPGLLEEQLPEEPQKEREACNAKQAAHSSPSAAAAAAEGAPSGTASEKAELAELAASLENIREENAALVARNAQLEARIARDAAREAAMRAELAELKPVGEAGIESARKFVELHQGDYAQPQEFFRRRTESENLPGFGIIEEWVRKELHSTSKGGRGGARN